MRDVKERPRPLSNVTHDRGPRIGVDVAIVVGWSDADVSLFYCSFVCYFKVAVEWWELLGWENHFDARAFSEADQEERGEILLRAGPFSVGGREDWIVEGEKLETGLFAEAALD